MLDTISYEPALGILILSALYEKPGSDENAHAQSCLSLHSLHTPQRAEADEGSDHYLGLAMHASLEWLYMYTIRKNVSWLGHILFVNKTSNNWAQISELL